MSEVRSDGSGEVKHSPVRVLFLFGTRPEVIKIAPVARVMMENPLFDVVLCTTGQHRELVARNLEFFGLTARYNLNLMIPGQSLLSLAGNLLRTIEPVLDEASPDLVVVQGDTTSAMIGSLAAFMSGIPVAHLEAGLRTGRKDSPFPEELNRILIGDTASLHFAPTQQAVDNLHHEGITENVWLVGNTVIDALLLGLRSIESSGDEDYYRHFEEIDFSRRIVLVTAHRRESFGTPMIEICNALRSLVERNPSVEIVFPVHPNPEVRKVVDSILKEIPEVNLIEPLDYPHLIWLMSKSYIILTDSGGIQEEAPTLGKPVLVLREVSERMEGVDAGTALIVGTSGDNILHQAERLLNCSDEYDSMAKATNPYGDGTTSNMILKILAEWIKKERELQGHGAPR